MTSRTRLTTVVETTLELLMEVLHGNGEFDDLECDASLLTVLDVHGDDVMSLARGTVDADDYHEVVGMCELLVHQHDAALCEFWDTVATRLEYGVFEGDWEPSRVREDASWRIGHNMGYYLYRAWSHTYDGTHDERHAQLVDYVVEEVERRGLAVS